jgi:hypothetical protein
MIVNKTVLFSSAKVNSIANLISQSWPTLIINLNDLTVLPASGEPGFVRPARSSSTRKFYDLQPN